MAKDHADVARAIVDAANMYGREHCIRYARETMLASLIAAALQNAFDLGFRAAGGTVYTAGEHQS